MLEMILDFFVANTLAFTMAAAFLLPMVIVTAIAERRLYKKFREENPS